MPDKGGVAEALTEQLQAMGVEVLRIDGAPDADALANRLRTGWPPVRCTESTGCPRWTTRETSAIWTWPPGTKPCGCASNRFTPPCALSTSRLRSRARSWSRRRGSAGSTATTRPERSRRWAARWRASPKPTSGSGRTPWSKPSISKPDGTASEVAEILIEETLRDPGAVEIGYKGGQRWTVGLEEQPAADGQPGLTLDKDTVFLVTGAAGSIVSAITADLAAASGGTFYLLDLVPEPDPDNPDLKRFVSDKEGLKRDLFARIQARGERATPALVEKELAALERAQAARSAIDAVRAAGGTAHYFSVNLTDADARGQGHRPGARAQRTHRRAAARRRHRAQPLPAG